MKTRGLTPSDTGRAALQQLRDAFASVGLRVSATKVGLTVRHVGHTARALVTVPRVFRGKFRVFFSSGAKGLLEIGGMTPLTYQDAARAMFDAMLDQRKRNPEMSDAAVRKRGYALGNTMLFAEKDGNDRRQSEVEDMFESWLATLSPRQRKLASEGWISGRWRETKRGDHWVPSV